MADEINSNETQKPKLITDQTLSLYNTKLVSKIDEKIETVENKILDQNNTFSGTNIFTGALKVLSKFSKQERQLPLVNFYNSSANGSGRPKSILYNSTDYDAHRGEILYDAYTSSIADETSRPQDGIVMSLFWDSTYYSIRQFLFTSDNIYTRHREASTKEEFDANSYSDWSPFGISSGSNTNGRWIRLPDGTQICWGGNTAIQNATINLPVPYIDTSYSVSITQAHRTSNFESNLCAHTLTTTSFKCFVNAAAQGFWMTIGRWK